MATRKRLTKPAKRRMIKPVATEKAPSAKSRVTKRLPTKGPTVVKNGAHARGSGDRQTHELDGVVVHVFPKQGGQGVGAARFDALGAELAQSYLENVTGADDAAMEHRAEVTPEEDGGPFIITTVTDGEVTADEAPPTEPRHDVR